MSNERNLLSFYLNQTVPKYWTKGPETNCNPHQLMNYILRFYSIYNATSLCKATLF